MITYDNRSWLGSLPFIWGTVLPRLAFPTTIVAVWAYFCCWLQDVFPDYFIVDVGPAGKILGGFTTFFLIFRTNQAFNRYWASNDCLKEIQVVGRELHHQFIVYIKGGCMAKTATEKKEWEGYASSCKADATRYILAFCVSFKLHSRISYDGYMKGQISEDVMQQINFDRARLRGLLSPEEYAIVQGMLHIEPEPVKRWTWLGYKTIYKVETLPVCRPSHAMIFFLRCLCHQASLAQKSWGWLERSLNLTDVSITHLMHAFEAMDQAICTPLPLPYSHLCKLLMLVFILTFPIFELSGAEDDTWTTKVMMTSIIAISMFGLECISMEIENPFGEDLNDFDTMRIIAAIEGSIWDVLTTRNDPSMDSFDWVMAPAEYNKCGSFLCLRAETGSVLQMMHGAYVTHQTSKASGGLRSVFKDGHWQQIHDSEEQEHPWHVEIHGAHHTHHRHGLWSGSADDGDARQAVQRQSARTPGFREKQPLLHNGEANEGPLE